MLWFFFCLFKIWSCRWLKLKLHALLGACLHWGKREIWKAVAFCKNRSGSLHTWLCQQSRWRWTHYPYRLDCRWSFRVTSRRWQNSRRRPWATQDSLLNCVFPMCSYLSPAKHFMKHFTTGTKKVWKSTSRFSVFIEQFWYLEWTFKMSLFSVF